jgi:predicted HTH domain antitoxin
MPVQTIIDLPDPLYRTLSAHGLSKEVISREARKLLALKCYKERILSLGKSAEFSGVPLCDFIEFLGKSHIAVVDYDDEQLKYELKSVEQIAEGL